MVKYLDADLNKTFGALADPTRRALLARLAQEPQVSVSELARPLTIKLPAVMKHLDVLANAGLIERRKAGRTVSVSLASRPMQDAAAWLNRYEGFWTERLERLVSFAEEQEKKPK